MTQPTTGDQAEPQSLSDRVGAMFGLSDDPQETPVEALQDVSDDAEADPESATAEEAEVEYDGERFRVPKKLEKAIMQERDYTQKTQEVAEQRRMLEQTQQAMKIANIEQDFAQSTAVEFQQLQALDGYIQNLNSQKFAEMTTDEKMDALLNIQQAERHREAVKASIESKRSQHKTQLDAAITEAKDKAMEVLSKQIPGFKPETLGEVRTYAKSLGFTDVALDSIEMDARSALVIHKAMRFDQLQATKGTATQQLNAPVVRPGAANPMPQLVRDKLAFNKSMKSAKTSTEKARLIENRLAGMF